MEKEQQELKRRQKMMDEYKELLQRMPEDIAAKLFEHFTTDDQKNVFMEASFFAIKFGRALERRDIEDCKPLIVMPNGVQPSALLLSMMTRSGKAN